MCVCVSCVCVCVCVCVCCVCNVSGVHVSAYANTIIVHAAASDIDLEEILTKFEAVFTGR